MLVSPAMKSSGMARRLLPLPAPVIRILVCLQVRPMNTRCAPLMLLVTNRP